ncbi:serine/threonine protein phosphatase 1 [Rubricella aquisinus]|uniref:Serine/threonine protein phosphatase 1 n=1 Tax=Rubricella aquisinus TaxID=2028108 RepID=A0A840WK21_9RHOB|nr:metallophosphoesterase [Rubricella aquisinus]MBB5514523.1 serine/threonine protein phosphatase 1 [Rubricella aquisinus]
MTTAYAIGDVHGHLDKLRAAHDLIAADRDRTGNDAPVIHLGDLVDRGPHSAEVMDYVIETVARDPRNRVILGNHDRMFAWFLEDQPRHDPKLFEGLSWLHQRLGGQMTLASYGIDPTGPPEDVHREARARVPQSHVNFIRERPLTQAMGELFFVHAGLRSGVPIPEQTVEDMLWIREDFLMDTHDHGPVVVHGHTPVEEVVHHGTRIGLDTGAAFGGPLSPVVFEGRAAFLLTPTGRAPVPSAR